MTQKIEYLAGAKQAEQEAFIDKAVRHYIAQFRHEKVRSEMEAFERQYETLLAQYEGHYVAIHNGQVIDHDPDLRTLHLRVFDHLGHTPVLLKQVTKSPGRKLVFRSPRFEVCHSLFLIRIF